MDRKPLHILLLAAGLSSRMGQDNKLLLDFRNKPLIRQVAEKLVAAGIGGVTVVTGYENEMVEAVLGDLKLETIRNPEYQQGQMSSVRFGMNHIINSGQACSGVMVALGDMPFLEASHYRHISNIFETHGGQFITVPYALAQRGNPIVIPESLMAEVAEGSLNAGCRKLIEKRADKVMRVDVQSQAFVCDIDTPTDYQENIIMEGRVFPACC